MRIPFELQTDKYAKIDEAAFIQLISPLGTSADDGPGLQAALNKYAGVAPVRLNSGMWNILNSVTIPSKTVLVGSPGVTIVGNLQSGAGSTKATFLAQGTLSGVNTTLAATPTQGTNTISSNKSYPAGSTITVALAANAFQLQTFTVVSVSGAGPYTLTLDRPVFLAFASGDTVTGWSAIPTDIHILGRGMKFTGAPQRHVEFAMAYRCSVEDVVADTSGGSPTGADYWFSFDTGGRENLFRNVHVESANLANTGIALESNERSVVRDCSVDTPTTYGFLLLDCIQCTLFGCNGWGSGQNGLSFNGELAGSGCWGCRDVGGSYVGAAVNGVQVTTGSVGTTLIGTAADNSASVGILVDGSAAVVGTHLVGCKARGAGAQGVQITPGAIGTMIDSLDVSFAKNTGGSSGVFVQAPTQMANIFMQCSSTYTDYGIQFNTAGNLCSIHGLTILRSAANGLAAIVMGGPGTLRVSGAHIVLGPNDNGVNALAGTLHLTGVTMKPVGAKSGEIGVLVNGGTVRFVSGIDLDACATTTSVASGALSRGTVVANGTTGVDITFPDAKSTDRLLFTLRTIGGTVGHPKYTTVAGSKFTFTSDASDTSTYEYNVL